VAQVDLVFFKESDGEVPMKDWFGSLQFKPRIKCIERLQRLKQLGHKLKRPEADYLRDGLYELRVKHSGINYRMLYFFHGQKAVIVSHGFTKKTRKVPTRELMVAKRRMVEFKSNPKAHSFLQED
jgi:phage-related protein